MSSVLQRERLFQVESIHDSSRSGPVLSVNLVWCLMLMTAMLEDWKMNVFQHFSRNTSYPDSSPVVEGRWCGDVLPLVDYDIWFLEVIERPPMTFTGWLKLFDTISQWYEAQQQIYIRLSEIMKNKGFGIVEKKTRNTVLVPSEGCS